MTNLQLSSTTNNPPAIGAFGVNTMGIFRGISPRQQDYSINSYT